MLFTNGRLQSFEQMMKQPPHHPHRSPKKQPQSNTTDSPTQLNMKENNRDDLGEKTAIPTDSEE
ncbi:hypothetical protein D3C76_56500 [compost metagenome]